jgi:adenosylcobinamide-GDP ribazoletransferase
MPDRLRPIVAALSFLTAVPVGRDAGVGERDLRRGAALFPLVGAAVGTLIAFVVWAAAFVVPPFAAAVLGVSCGVAVTAAIHLDGLGDIADGVGASLSGRDPRDAMRDPRLGAFGVVAIALDLLLKASLVSALVGERFPWAVIAAGALSRLVPVFLAGRSRYTGTGIGAWTQGLDGSTKVIAAVFALAIAAPCVGWTTAGMVAGIAVAAAPIVWWSNRHLGGLTGDGFGAATELADVVSLLLAVSLGTGC